MYPLAFRKLAHYISSFNLTFLVRKEHRTCPFMVFLNLFPHGHPCYTLSVQFGVYTVQCRNDIKIYKSEATEHQAVSCLGCSVFDSSYKPESDKCK